MAKDSDQLASSFETENAGGALSGLLAEEDFFDRRTLWRLGSWGVARVGAVSAAPYANKSGIGWRREQIAAADLARQAQQIQSVAKESQNETRRLASAIDTLNTDRDRLYSRVTVLEQGLDSVTGAIARQTAVASTPAAPAASASADPPPSVQNPPPAPAVSAVATTAAAPAEKPRADATVPQAAPAMAPSAAQARLAPDRRHQRRFQRARHAAAAGGRPARRRGSGGENLRRHDRKRAAVRDHRVRRSTPRHEGR